MQRPHQQQPKQSIASSNLNTIEQRSREVGKGTLIGTGPASKNAPLNSVKASLQQHSRDKNLLEIDGFVIKEDETMESFTNPISVHLPCTERTSADIQSGCIVTWIVQTDLSNTSPFGTLAVGMVSALDNVLNRVQVKVLRIIDQTNRVTNRKLSLNQQLPMVDTLVWIPSASLYRVKGRNRVLLTEHVPIKKKRKEIIPKKNPAKKIPPYSSKMIPASKKTEKPSDQGKPKAKRKRTSKEDGTLKQPKRHKPCTYNNVILSLMLTQLTNPFCYMLQAG
jgi:hypothetical protein